MESSQTSQQNKKSILDLEYRYENYWEILKYNHDMIRFSEVKAGLVISVLGVLFSLLFQSVDKIKGLVLESIPIMVVAGIFAFCTIVAVMYSFRCFIPRFENKNPTSVIFFGDIVSDFSHFNAYHKFIETVMNDEKEFSLQLAEQIHTNASIATRKFKAVSVSIRFLLYAIVCLMAMVCLMYLT